METMFRQNFGGTNKEYHGIFESGLLIKSSCHTEHNRGDINAGKNAKESRNASNMIKIFNVNICVNKAQVRTRSSQLQRTSAIRKVCTTPILSFCDKNNPVSAQTPRA